jgi:hypothetical protein
LMIQMVLVSEMINGFAHLKTPIIVDETPDVISTIIVEDLFRRS